MPDAVPDNISQSTSLPWSTPGTRFLQSDAARHHVINLYFPPIKPKKKKKNKKEKKTLEKVCMVYFVAVVIAEIYILLIRSICGLTRSERLVISVSVSVSLCLSLSLSESGSLLRSAIDYSSVQQSYRNLFVVYNSRPVNSIGIKRKTILKE